MTPHDLAERLARGGSVQELSRAEQPINANRLYRIWVEEGSRIVKVYGTPARERRERHSLDALADLPGMPNLLDSGSEGDLYWALFADAGQWSLATLPENPGLARQAGEILAGLHATENELMTNMTRGIDQQWVSVDFISTFRRLARYRGRLGLSSDLMDAARAVRPPYASAPRAAHTNPTPDNFLVDDDGKVTLINWEWATLAPPEWDLSKAVWLASLESGPASAAGVQQGYGKEIDQGQLDRWTVYHAGMMLVSEAENRISGRLTGLDDLIGELQRAVAGATSSVS
ncbi:MAG: aminoglycoside phosphotransferase family protein [Acidimicrobiia bacterium]|nr:aminoglycoside phosphotransferase family protein [Acidimicrobiia bacterium]NNC75727.1 aminoglycoside phosphotransferase family protein [Acidimicrobiia bacterium]